MNNYRHLPNESLRLKRTDRSLQEQLITVGSRITACRSITHRYRGKIIPHMTMSCCRLHEKEYKRIGNTKYKTKQWKRNSYHREFSEGYSEKWSLRFCPVLISDFLICWQHFSRLHFLLKTLRGLFGEPKKKNLNSKFIEKIHCYTICVYEIASVRQLKHLITVIFMSCVFKAQKNVRRKKEPKRKKPLSVQMNRR